MLNKSPKALNGLIGILGAGLIILSIVLFTMKDAGVIFKTSLAAVLQLDMGLLLTVYGVRENRSKGRPKGDMYFAVGLAVLTSTAYTLYDLYTKLAK